MHPIGVALYKYQNGICDRPCLKQKNLPSRPISVWDSEYGCAPFVLKSTNIPGNSTYGKKKIFICWVNGFIEFPDPNFRFV